MSRLSRTTRRRIAVAAPLVGVSPAVFLAAGDGSLPHGWLLAGLYAVGAVLIIAASFSRSDRDDR